MAMATTTTITRNINNDVWDEDVKIIPKGHIVYLLDADIDEEYQSGVKVKVRDLFGEDHWIDSSFLLPE